MPISRRGFLGCAAGASTIGLANRSRLDRFFQGNLNVPSEYALVDAGPSCTLRESLAGYESAFASAQTVFGRTSLQSLGPARTIILPAAAFMDESPMGKVRSHLARGATVLYESGAAFLEAKDFDFHRRLAMSVFGISLHAPVRLWDSADSSKQSPYVDYRWPRVTKVRDFSRILPVDSRHGETIAWFRDMPVAVKCRAGQGTLVFLGSPMGPHLLAGDREAHDWFGAFCSSC